jgi:hypothetical protein
VEIVETSLSAAGTGNLSWQASNNSTTGLLVLIVADDTTPSDEITEVTVAGRKMQEVSGSPFLHTAGSEDGVIYAYFLSYPGISGTVTVTVSGATTKRGLAIGLKGADGSLLTVCGASTKDVSGATKITSEEIGGLARKNLIIGALHSGADAVGTITVPATEELLAQHDFGTTTAHWLARKENIYGRSDLSLNSSVEEEGGLFAVAVSPIQHHGLLSTPPTEGIGRGDTCDIIADETKGVIWEFVYDGLGEFPWKKIGGPPLRDEVQKEESTESLAYANLATVGPAMTVPLKGDYEVRIEFNSAASPAVTNVCLMSYAIGAAAASDEDRAEALIFSSIEGGVSVGASRVKTGIAAGTTLTAKYRLGIKNKVVYRLRRLIVDPVRIG